MSAGSPHARMERWLGTYADSLPAVAYAELVALWRDTTALIAAPPAPQRHPDALEDGSLSKFTAKRDDALRMAQGDSAVALEVYLSTTWDSAAMRIEALATWLDQQEANCGLLSIAAADLRAMSAKLHSEPTGEGDSWFADTLTSMGEVIPLTTQPPHQDRGEVEQDVLLSEVIAALKRYAEDYAIESISTAAEYVVAALTEAKQQGPGEAVAWQQLYGGRWEERSEDQYRYMVRQNAERPGAFTVRALGVIAPQVEAKRQTGEGLAELRRQIGLNACYAGEQVGDERVVLLAVVMEKLRKYECGELIAAAAKPSGDATNV